MEGAPSYLTLLPRELRRMIVEDCDWMSLVFFHLPEMRDGIAKFPEPGWSGHPKWWAENLALFAVQKKEWLGALEWAVGLGLCSLSEKVACEATLHGDIRVCQWLHEKDCTFGVLAWCRAVEGGNVAVLNWLAKEIGLPRGEILNARFTEAALQSNKYLNLGTLKWLHGANLFCFSSTCWQALVRKGDIPMLDWLLSVESQYVYRHATPNGMVPHMMNLCHEACLYIEDEDRCIEILEWLKCHGCPIWSGDYGPAAFHARWKLLKWLHHHGVPLRERACSQAAAGGKLAVLKWARELGCPWDRSTCLEAKRSGHLEILQWAIENGCPNDESNEE